MKYLISISALIITIALPVNAGVYRWVDAQGQTHYSSQPPEGKTAESIKVKPLQKIQDSDIEEKYANDEKKEKEDQKQAEYNRQAQQQATERNTQLKQACDGMRKDLALYKNEPRTRININGVVRRLTPEELTTKITELQKNIEENCQDF